MHIGRTCNEHLCKDLYVDEWKLEVEIDPHSGKPAQSEVFGGPVQMKLKSEQKYLGDVIS